MSIIYFNCRHCNKTLEATREAVGRKIQCYKCNEKFEVTPLDIIDEPKKIQPEVKKDVTHKKPTRKKKKTFPFLPAILIIGICALAYFLIPQNQQKETVSENSPSNKLIVDKAEETSPHNGFLKEVEDSCFRCHGKVKNGKPNVKGDFNLSELLAKKSLSIEDSSKWLKVLHEVESKRMPPEDSKEEISDEQRSQWKNKLITDLSKQNMQERILTASEIDSDHALLFDYKKSHYNPFETLKLLKRSESRYPTIKSAELMSRTFLESLQYGLTELIQDYSLNSYRANHGHTMKVGETSIASIRTGVTTSAENLDGKEKGSQHFDFRTWGRQRLYAKGHPRFGIVPGKYKITFSASALNRDLISKVKSQYESNPKNARHVKPLMKNWGDLYYSKARISLINSGNDNKQSRKDGVFHTFEIDDNTEKEYSAEFTMTTATLLDLSFDNGPYNPRKHWVKLGKEKRLDGKDYNFPCVRINNIRITKLEDIPSKNDFDISKLKGDQLNDDSLLEKLKAYSNAIGSGKSYESLKKLYSELPKELDIKEKYSTALRLISMSPEYLYINFNGDSLQSDARYISYSLLKHKPSDEFIKKFTELSNGSIQTSEFVNFIVKEKGFNSFLESFTTNWLKYEVPLDSKKFNLKLQNMKVNKETVSYLDHIFKNNRPLKELYVSNYRVLDQSMAAFYGIKAEEKTNTTTYKINGGVLKQAAFFRSQSDGIDGLPFRRSEWILENVFDTHLGSPPNNIDTDEFAAAKKLKTFRERTEFHSQKSACTGCHKKIDPIAFGVNHLGTLGWETEKPEQQFVSSLGEKVSNAEKQIASAFTKHLISYIIGRDLTVFDHLVYKKILNASSTSGFKAKDILGQIISHYFLSKNKGS